VALNELTAGARISRDIDLFHDTREALASSWTADRVALFAAGYVADAINERPGFVQAVVRRDADSVLLEWTHDSAYRFFPLVEHPELGVTLHPFDLATNKVLALVGRVEPRDWVDVIHCNDAVQPLGLLAWAACAKDLGFSPAAIVEHASRTARYSADELLGLDFEGTAPDVLALSTRWRAIVQAARESLNVLPSDQVGSCVMAGGGLFRGDAAALRVALASGVITFRRGSIRGAFPRIVTH
jgi:hypothetical protein